MALLQDADGTCRRKALLAISCLVRQSAPAMAAFRLSGGVPRLIAVSSDPDPRLARCVVLPHVVVSSQQMPSTMHHMLKSVVAVHSELPQILYPCSHACNSPSQPLILVESSRASICSQVWDHYACE